MKVDIKKRWIEALRSGDFRQGRGRLHNVVGDCYCCLGVLHKVMFPDVEVPEKQFLSVEATDESGVNYSRQMRLSFMNDGKGAYNDQPLTFAQIADYIENEL